MTQTIPLIIVMLLLITTPWLTATQGLYYELSVSRNSYYGGGSYTSGLRMPNIL